MMKCGVEISTTLRPCNDSPELDSDENDPTPDEIHAAMEKSQKDSSHGPLVLKDVKSKRRNYPPRKKKV